MNSTIYGLILTGGKSTRMGRDKSLLSYHGKPQIEHAHDLLYQYCSKVFLSKRKDQPAYKNFAFIDDIQQAEGIGPLGGIVSAMKTHPDVAWLILACDLPFVNETTLSKLVACRDAKADATAFMNTQDSLPEPLCAIWEAHALGKIENFLAQGIQCPRKILIKSKTTLIHQDDPKWLDNINTLDEYQKIPGVRLD